MRIRVAALLTLIVTFVGSLPYCGLARGAEPALGRAMDEFRLPDHLGKDRSLGELAGERATVVAFLGTQCPLAKLYAGRLETIATKYADRGVAVVAVMSNVQDSLEEITSFTRRHEISYAV